MAFLGKQQEQETAQHTKLLLLFIVSSIAPQ